MNQLETKRLAKKEARLRAEIEAARSRGDRAELQRLQAEFRSSGIPVVRDGPAPVLLGGRGSAPRPVRSIKTPTKTKPGRKRKTQATPDAVEDVVPELRADAAPTLTVRISSAVRQAISDEIQETGWRLDAGIETGGWLFAWSRFGREIEAAWATRLAGGERRPDAVLLDDDVPEYLERRHSNATVIGSWHVHSSRPDPLPSPADRRVALLRCDDRGRSRWLSLIVTCPDGNWRRPKLNGWVTHRALGVVPVTEPVLLEGGF
jgi:hypothetical protein